MKNAGNLADAVLTFYENIQVDFVCPPGVELLLPHQNAETVSSMRSFYRLFYADKQPRIFIFGINPGRFGGGITGIPFTDPIRLQENCGIANAFKKLPELSSQFIYAMIDAYGGAEKFYRQFLITAISPLGFVKEGKNLNYYDDRNLLKNCEAFLLRSISEQLKFNPAGKRCFCLGEGENYKQFTRLNNEHHFFEEIVPLPHPRWVMQYRRKRMQEFIDLYLEAFSIL